MNDADTSAKPGIIDAFIICLFAIAIDIFVLWAATRLTPRPVFDKLPDFIIGAYSGIWSTVAASAAGIGLVIVKYLNRRRGRTVNYFVYVLGTAAGLLIVILAAAFISLFLVTRPSVETKRDETKRFDNPLYQNYHLDRCYVPRGQCDLIAATEFCKLEKYGRADTWEIAPGIGHTISMGDTRNPKIADGVDGFKSITCSGPIE